MRKVVKPAKICEHCGATLIRSVEARFCDVCKEKVPDDFHMDTTVFWAHREGTQRNEFCSWTCFFEWITNFPYNKKMVSFVSLPHLGGSDKDFDEEWNIFTTAIRGLESKASDE